MEERENGNAESGAGREEGGCGDDVEVMVGVIVLVQNRSKVYNFSNGSPLTRKANRGNHERDPVGLVYCIESAESLRGYFY